MTGDEPSMDSFKGKRISRVEITRGHGYATISDRIVFRFMDKTMVAYETAGECCSHSWIEHYSVPEDVEGSCVVDIVGSKTGEEDKEGYELLQFYETRFKTDKGDIVVEYRNNSNGYYGGSLVEVAL